MLLPVESLVAHFGKRGSGWGIRRMAVLSPNSIALPAKICIAAVTELRE